MILKKSKGLRCIHFLAPPIVDENLSMDIKNDWRTLDDGFTQAKWKKFGLGHGIVFWEFDVCEWWDWFTILDIPKPTNNIIVNSPNFEVGFP